MAATEPLETERIEIAKRFISRGLESGLKSHWSRCVFCIAHTQRYKCFGSIPLAEVATFASMSSEKFTDEYGFTGPLPTSSSQRVVPSGDFRPGLSIGEPAPDFELPNHRGEIVSFHADRNGVRTALLFYRSVVW